MRVLIITLFLVLNAVSFCFAENPNAYRDQVLVEQSASRAAQSRAAAIAAAVGGATTGTTTFSVSSASMYTGYTYNAAPGVDNYISNKSADATFLTSLSSPPTYFMDCNGTENMTGTVVTYPVLLTFVTAHPSLEATATAQYNAYLQTVINNQKNPTAACCDCSCDNSC